ncbi:MAG: hypothetical protein V1863_05040 [Candidatus Omnitrophota bacterium]
MRRRKMIWGWIFVLMLLFTFAGNSLAQVKQEKEEKTFEPEKLQERPSEQKLSSAAAIFYGYDSNALLSPTRKGDTFQEVLYGLSFIKRWNSGFRFTFDYDLDVQTYNEITQASSILNHFRVGLHEKFEHFLLGTGYDLGISDYIKNDDGDFLFHKGFVYLRHFLTRKTYHQILVEAGLKDYDSRKALSDTIATYQNKELTERRLSAEYSIGSMWTPRLFFGLRLRFSRNDANARYLDFYDYDSYEFAPGLRYEWTDKLELLAQVNYLRKIYDSRTVTGGQDIVIENIISPNCGLRYRLNQNNTLTLLYIYRNDSSNEPLEEFNENVVSCGWQYNF